MADIDVLIVGAGPTGLVLALWLSKLGVKLRIVDKATEPGTTSRALAVQARTLELYRQLDLTEDVVGRGHKVPAVNLWVKGKPQARIGFEKIGQGLTPFPFLLVYPQDEHERLLIEKLARAGVAVERGVELLSFTDAPDGVTVRLRRPDGSDERLHARYIAGCDGARSTVRENLRVGFPGGTYRQVFYVADAEVSGAVANGELHIDLDEADFLAVFPLAGDGRARLVGTVRDERADRADTLQFEDVSRRAIEHLKVDVRRVHWFSTYHVHHRVTDHFRKGRAFLLGDAAHIHSPAGGQGMNTGIGDAINLAWKLAAVIGRRAPDALLDSYEAERMAFARRLVQTTDRIFTFGTAEGWFADILRTRIAPLVIPEITNFAFAREFLFRTVSQITLNYRDGPLSDGVAGRVQGGDRLPWVAMGRGDNFGPLESMDWQVHVYGTPSAQTTEACSALELDLRVFDWKPEFERAGLARDGIYLMRPDMYVALAATEMPDLKGYFATRGLRPKRSQAARLVAER